MDFNKVIETNKQNIKNIIRLITKEDNEDLEQEVYVKIWKNSDKYKEQGSIKSWISTITRNTSLDYLKSSYRKVFQTSTSDDLVITNIKDKKISPEETFCIFSCSKRQSSHSSMCCISSSSLLKVKSDSYFVHFSFIFVTSVPV